MNDKINLQKEYINSKFLIIEKMISNIEFNNSKLNNLFILEKVENLIFDLIDFYNNKKDTIKFNGIEINNIFDLKTSFLIYLIKKTLSTYLIRTDIEDKRKSSLIEKVFDIGFKEGNNYLIKNIYKSIFETTTFNTKINYLSLRVSLIKLIDKEIEKNDKSMEILLPSIKKYFEEEVYNLDICFAPVSIVKDENKDMVSKPYFKIYQTLINNFLISLSKKDNLSKTDKSHLEYIFNIEKRMLTNTDLYYKYSFDYEILLFDENNKFKILDNEIMESIKNITFEKINIIEQKQLNNNSKEEILIINNELLKLKLFLLTAFSTIIDINAQSLNRCSDTNFIGKFISNQNNLITKSTIELLSEVIEENYLYNASEVRHNRTNNKTLFSSFFQITNNDDENMYRVLYGDDFMTKNNL